MSRKEIAASFDATGQVIEDEPAQVVEAAEPQPAAEVQAESKDERKEADDESDPLPDDDQGSIN